MVEREQAEPVCDALLAGCKHRTPKVAVGAIETLHSIVRDFGAAALPYKTLLKALPPFFEHADRKFRPIAVDLAVELHRYLGPVVAQQLADLRSAQLTELQVTKHLLKLMELFWNGFFLVLCACVLKLILIEIKHIKHFSIEYILKIKHL